MPKLTIDGRAVEVEAGATILDAARKLGVHIPALCHLPGLEPRVSCMACAVKLEGGARFLPACATPAAEGMRVLSDTPEVREQRRKTLELLLGSHAGDCNAPCEGACPAGLDIPQLLSSTAEGDWDAALALAVNALVLPGALGRICPAPCEKACRRGAADAAVAIRTVHAALPEHGTPAPGAKAAGRGRVAVIGAGPAGLAAAYRLARLGRECHLFEREERPGGALLRPELADRLPAYIVERDAAAVFAAGVAFHPGVEVDREPNLNQLLQEFEAVVIATGSTGKARNFGLETSSSGLATDPRTFATGRARVFAAGGAVKPLRLAAMAVAAGKRAALSAHQMLSGQSPTPEKRRICVRMGELSPGELARLLLQASPEPRRKGGGETLAAAELQEEATRCLQCACRKHDNCRLREEAESLGASPTRYKGKRPWLELDDSHPEVLYEPGKCIKCGLCVAIAARAGERAGLTFLGRGDAARVTPPPDYTLREALALSARECAAACPTGALSLRRV